MIHRRILHLEAHWGYWPRISLHRCYRVGDVTPDGVLEACPTCSTVGFLSRSTTPREPTRARDDEPDKEDKP
jgi:hypothetical protein